MQSPLFLSLKKKRNLEKLSDLHILFRSNPKRVTKTNKILDITLTAFKILIIYYTFKSIW